MNCAGFFMDVEARVGIAAPVVDRPDSRPAAWHGTDHFEDANPRGLDPDGTIVVLDADEVEWNQGTWPDDRYDPEDFLDWFQDDLGWVDAIAAYRPWHVYRWQWGVVIDEWRLGCFVEAIASEAGLQPARVASLVARQVLAHEFVHFGFEIAATEMEDLLGEPRYLAYLSSRFGNPNRWTAGPLEELIATWAEAQFVESLPARGPGSAPRSYRRAVTSVNRAAPPGYCDFELMANSAQAERIVADAGSLIADRELWSPRWWPRVGSDETSQVPLYWQGDPANLGLFGLGKSVAPPSIRRFEKWLYSVVGATPLKGKKHAKAELPNGRRVTYKDDGADLLPPEAQQIAHKLGLPNRRALYECVARGEAPPI